MLTSTACNHAALASKLMSKGVLAPLAFLLKGKPSMHVLPTSILSKFQAFHHQTRLNKTGFKRRALGGFIGLN